MANLSFGNWTNGIVSLALGGWVVGRQDGGNGSNDGAHLVIHLLRLWFLDNGAEGWALLRVGGRDGVVLGIDWDGYGRVLVQVGVVVCLCAYDGTGLAGLGKVDIRMRWR